MLPAQQQAPASLMSQLPSVVDLALNIRLLISTNTFDLALFNSQLQPYAQLVISEQASYSAVSKGKQREDTTITVLPHQSTISSPSFSITAPPNHILYSQRRNNIGPTESTDTSSSSLLTQEPIHKKRRVSRHDDTGIYPRELQPSGAKIRFFSKWMRRTSNHAALQNLSRFEILFPMENKGQQPFFELDRLMERCWGFGSAKVQQDFVSNLGIWMRSDDRDLPPFDLPSNLDALEPWKRDLFGRLSTATQITNHRRGKLLMNRALWRISLLKEMNEYHGIIEALKDYGVHAGPGGGTFRDQVIQVLQTMFQGAWHTSVFRQTLSEFDRKFREVRPWLALQQHCKSDGVSVLIPANFTDDLVSNDQRIEAFLEALDILLPGFRTGAYPLQIYSNVVNSIYLGRKPEADDIETLQQWTTRPEAQAVSLESTTPSEHLSFQHSSPNPLPSSHPAGTHVAPPTIYPSSQYSSPIQLASYPPAGTHVAPPPPGIQYANELRLMNEMGFGNFENNIYALTRSQGSVQGAVEFLLSHQMD
ncbi:MAG: hypothetical protein L6R40_002364 [Gallowayella cf. fulva]|nr:MAG: hypothetical protein L6R40_002364 [Xanthomendoza cf. fulva]